jgi:NAD(P)-dependent dehydrogenase (short-subunit alcohol dehydrogenase family)
MKSFQGKVAAITGAASGMGRSIAYELARRGCQLALSDVNEAGLAETARVAGEYGVRVSTHRLDVSQREAMDDWAARVMAEHGQVNLIVNNAGVALGAPLSTVKPADFEWIMGINFWGVVWGTQAFLPYLKRGGDGHVVNISSLFGLLSLPSQGTYNASKFAVRGFTEALRQELDIARCGVSATCVHPGGIRTNIARHARLYDDLGLSRHGEGAAPNAAESLERFDKLLDMTTADSAARQIVRAVQGNKRRVLIGPDAKFLDLLVRLCGSGYQPITTMFARLGMGS